MSKEFLEAVNLLNLLSRSMHDLKDEEIKAVFELLASFCEHMASEDFRKGEVWQMVPMMMPVQ